MNEALFELVFMLVILKLPILYLCGVVWWAVKAEPRPPEGAGRVVTSPVEPCPWRGPSRPYPGRGSSRRVRAGARR